MTSSTTSLSLLDKSYFNTFKIHEGKKSRKYHTPNFKLYCKAVVIKINIKTNEEMDGTESRAHK